MQEHILMLDASSNKHKSENMALNTRVEEQTAIIEKLRSDIVSKDLKMNGLQNENNELHMLLNNKKQSNRGDMDQIIKDHKQERKDWEELRESKNPKIIFRPNAKNPRIRENAQNERDRGQPDEAQLPEAG